MPRRKKVQKRELVPDPKFKSALVAKFINNLMLDGKKSVAESIFYRAMDHIEDRTGQNGLEVFEKAVENVKPIIEVKSRRVGGATYQVPIEIRADRRLALSFRWLISFAKPVLKIQCLSGLGWNLIRLPRIRVLPLKNVKIPTKWLRQIRLLHITAGRFY